MNQIVIDFAGETYVRERDGARLTRQLDIVKAQLLDGLWHTLHELSEKTGAPEASISARIRDLKKAAHGGYTIDRVYVMRGLFRYRMRTA